MPEFTTSATTFLSTASSGTTTIPFTFSAVIFTRSHKTTECPPLPPSPGTATQLPPPLLLGAAPAPPPPDLITTDPAPRTARLDTAIALPPHPSDAHTRARARIPLPVEAKQKAAKAAREALNGRRTLPLPRPQCPRHLQQAVCQHPIDESGHQSVRTLLRNSVMIIKIGTPPAAPGGPLLLSRNSGAAVL